MVKSISIEEAFLNIIHSEVGLIKSFLEGIQYINKDETHNQEIQNYISKASMVILLLEDVLKEKGNDTN